MASSKVFIAPIPDTYRFAVYVDGLFRFSADEAECERWVALVIYPPQHPEGYRDGMLGRSIGY